MRILVAVLVLLAATACGGQDAGTAPAPSSAPADSAPAGGEILSGEATVEVKQFTFTPAVLTVTVGTKVTWKFLDSAKHNVKSKDGGFSSEDLADGATFTHTFDKVGEYPYICSIHQYMTASVTVR